VAYSARVGGSWDIFVESFPEPGTLWRISTAGGYQPHWNPGGTELFYLAPDRTLMSARVKRTDTTFEWDPPTELFRTSALELGPLRDLATYAVGPGSQSFLINTRTEAPPTPATLLINGLE